MPGGDEDLGARFLRFGAVIRPELRDHMQFARESTRQRRLLPTEQPRRALVAALCVSGLGFASFATGLVNEIVAIPAALAALLLAIALTSNRPGNPLASWPLHRLGELSFSTYLSHSLLWTAFKMAFVASAVAVSPLLIGALLFGILLASLALYHGVERPAQAWINRFGQTPKRGQQTR